MNFSGIFLLSIQFISSIKSNSLENHRSALSNLNLVNPLPLGSKIPSKISPSTSVVSSHPLAILTLGQISALATSPQAPRQLFIFHRATREWNFESFPDQVHFDTEKFQAIEENTILSLDFQTGQLTDQWANHTFFMPHGLFIDHQANLWLTDVAMQQVFKYTNGTEMLRLGELFVPGRDHSHFCQPTDVVVSQDNNHVYVSDGYCNSRVVQFDSNGTFIKQFQMPEEEKPLFIPHSLALITSLQLLCVADRQNGRIVCFDLANGNVQHIISDAQMHTVYAITADEKNNVLYAVSGKDPFSSALGLTFSIHPDSFGHLIQTWKPTEDFGEPHDLALSADGQALFVGTIRPNRIHLFNISYPINQ